MVRDRNIWFFGDSYIEHDDNWVRFVADRCKAKIQELGVGGSSVPYLLDRLHNCAPKIKKEDFVIVAITDVRRQYLGGLHLMTSMVRTPDMEHLHMNPYAMIENEFVRRMGFSKDNWEKVRDVRYQMQILDMLNAYSNYIEHLHDVKIHAQENLSIVNNIILNILPNLPTKKVIYFYSISRDEYENSLFWVKGTQPTVESFWHQQLDYFDKEQGIADEGQIMNKLMTPNHWVTDPKMQKRFWSTNNPILKLIGADNPDFII